MARSLPVFFNCERCPAYCCSYPRIQVSQADLRRLAKHFDLSVAVARRRFTKLGHDPGERVLRHQKDESYGTVCRFLDSDSRECTVYEARPKICRDFPGLVRCGYYDFLAAERRMLEDENYVSTTYNFEA